MCITNLHIIIIIHLQGKAINWAIGHYDFKKLPQISQGSVATYLKDR